MPSRPVLIGRGLVSTTYTTTQTNCLRVHYQNTPPPQGVVPAPTSGTNQPRGGTTQHNNGLDPTHTNPPSYGPEEGWSLDRVTRVTAAIAKGKHPVPSRTRKLSLSAPMVLRSRGRGRVGRRRTYFEQKREHPTRECSRFCHFHSTAVPRARPFEP